MKYLYSLLGLTICAIIISFCIGAFFSYNYPMKYSSEIKRYSKEFDINSALVASVANVESNFREDVISNKGAKGIMQLMPATAEWVAGKINQDFEEERLLDGEYNLMLGSYYLSYLINYFNSEKLGVCAYNAGQGNVAAWLKNKDYSDDGKSLKKIDLFFILC